MTVFIFPGQGSQKKGMGGDLFDELKQETDQASDILGYSIKALCLEDPHNQLGQTQYTQPALYVVNALTYLKEIRENSEKPDFLLGHSLGEYNALFAAGAFDFATGLQLVKKRGALMSKAKGGKMAAVIGLKEEDIQQVIKKYDLKNIYFANYNSPSQIVIAGKERDMQKAETSFKEEGKGRYIPLNVSGAFHTPYMEPARDEFSAFLNTFEFGKLKTEVIANADATPYKTETIKTHLIQQITSSVQWTKSICYVMEKGQTEFKEIGPGKVLAGLVKKIQKERPAAS